MRLPAISLWQPWASLWFTDSKPYETRHWRYPERLEGHRILVHAAKRKMTVGEFEADGELQATIFSWFGFSGVHNLPHGALLGTVVLDGCFEADKVRLSRETRSTGNFAPGRFAWRRRDPMLFAAPIPALGRQGWWTVEVPDDAMEAA